MKFKVNDVLVDKESGRIYYVHSINNPILRGVMGKANYYSLVFRQMRTHDKNDKVLIVADVYTKEADKRLVKIGVL